MSSAIQLWEIPFHLLFLAAECVLVYAIVLRLRRLAVERSWVDLSGVVLWIVGAFGQRCYACWSYQGTSVVGWFLDEQTVPRNLIEHLSHTK